MPKDMKGVMNEFAHGDLHSGSSSGPRVANRKQAIAIGLSEQREMGKKAPHKKDHLSKALGGY
jgi:hypothetical protein